MLAVGGYDNALLMLLPEVRGGCGLPCAGSAAEEVGEGWVARHGWHQ